MVYNAYNFISASSYKRLYYAYYKCFIDDFICMYIRFSIFNIRICVYVI